MLRERLNAIDVRALDENGNWFDDAPPAKLSLFAVAAGELPPPGALLGDLVPLQRHVTCTDRRLAPLLAEWLHLVYVVRDAPTALARRAMLPAGAVLVSPQGHVFKIGRAHV